MPVQQLINGKVEIAGNLIPLKINAEDEEFVRQAGKLINSKIEELQTQFAMTDVKIALSIAVLDAVTELLKLQAQGESEKLATESVLNDLESILASDQI